MSNLLTRLVRAVDGPGPAIGYATAAGMVLVAAGLSALHWVS